MDSWNDLTDYTSTTFTDETEQIDTTVAQEVKEPEPKKKSKATRKRTTGQRKAIKKVKASDFEILFNAMVNLDGDNVSEAITKSLNSNAFTYLISDGKVKGVAIDAKAWDAIVEENA